MSVPWDRTCLSPQASLPAQCPAAQAAVLPDTLSQPFQRQTCIDQNHMSANPLLRLQAGMPARQLSLATDLIGDGSGQRVDLGLKRPSVLAQ